MTLSVLVACGNVNGVGGGGGDDDDDGSNTPPDGGSSVTRGTVKVTVIDRSGNGAPVVGAKVVFMDPDGSVVSTVASDADGRAQADVLPGGSVTRVIGVDTTTLDMITTRDIKPGEDITIGPVAGNDSAFDGNLTVTWNPVAGATRYQIYTPCGVTFATGSAVSSTSQILKRCATAAMEVVIVAQDDAFTTLGYNDKVIAYTPNATVAMNDTFAAGVTFRATIANAPAASTIGVTRVSAGFSFMGPAPTGGVSTLAPVPVSSTARLVTAIARGSKGQQQKVNSKLAGNATTAAVDCATTLLPWMTVPVLDAATHTFTIPHDRVGANAVADLLQYNVLYKHGDTTVNWVVNGPDADTVVLPQLPAEAGTVPLPDATDMLVFNTASLNKAEGSGGYDAIRSHVGEAMITVFVDQSATLYQTSFADFQ